MTVGQDGAVGIATCYDLDGPGIKSCWEARFSAPVQTDSAGHPASYTMCTGFYPGVMPPGRDVDHPHPFSAEVKERVELLFYYPLGLRGLLYGGHYFLSYFI